MVGCIGIIKRSESKSQLRWLLLDSKFRGRGIGNDLVKKAINYSRDELKVKEVYLSTLKGLPVIKLYEKEGFKLVKETEMELWGARRTEQIWELVL